MKRTRVERYKLDGSYEGTLTWLESMGFSRRQAESIIRNEDASEFEIFLMGDEFTLEEVLEANQLFNEMVKRCKANAGSEHSFWCLLTPEEQDRLVQVQERYVLWDDSMIGWFGRLSDKVN